MARPLALAALVVAVVLAVAVLREGVLTVTVSTGGQATVDVPACFGVATDGRGPASLRAAFPALREDRLAPLPRRLARIGGTTRTYPAGARLWGAYEGHAFWVVPARDCDGRPVACVVGARGTTIGASACAADRREGTAVRTTTGPPLWVGFAPPGAAHARARTEGGGADGMVSAGVFASATLASGPLEPVSFVPGREQGRYLGPFAVIDQTGDRAEVARVRRTLRGRESSGVGYGDQTVIDLADAGPRRTRSVVLHHRGEAAPTGRKIARRLGLPRQAMTRAQQRRYPTSVVIVLARGR